MTLLDVPAARPVATGELVDLRAWPTYRDKHGLVRERIAWPPHSPYPIVTVSVATPLADPLRPESERSSTAGLVAQHPAEPAPRTTGGPHGIR